MGLASARAVILVRHRVCGPGGKARWRQDELRSPDLVLVRASYEGAYRDETLAPEYAQGCASIRFVLGGSMVTRAQKGAVDLREGHLYVSATHGAAPARALVEASDILVIGWRLGTCVGERPPGDACFTPSRSTAVRLRRLADALAADDGAEKRIHAAADALAALRAEGLPLTDTAAAALRGHPQNDTANQRVATAVERSVASLSSSPTSIDLAGALDVGEHHALRCANAHFRRFYFSVNGWREYLRRRRIDLGAFFMGRADARTEDVARVLGFRSPTSFCHALNGAGLPSPRALQRLLIAS